MIGKSIIYFSFGAFQTKNISKNEESDLIQKIDKLKLKKWKLDIVLDDKYPRGFIELSDGSLAYFSNENLKVLNKNFKLEEEFHVPHFQIIELYNGNLLTFDAFYFTIQIWNRKGICLKTLSNGELIESLVYKNNEHLIISRYGEVLSLNINTGVHTLIYKVHSDMFRQLCTLSDDSIACKFQETTILIIDMKGKVLQKLSEHSQTILGIKELKNHSLCTWSEDLTVKIWNRKNESSIMTLKGHTKPVTCMKEKDNFLISSSLDGTLRFWKKEDGVCIKIFDVYESGIQKFKFMYDQILTLPKSFEKGYGIWGSDCFEKEIKFLNLNGVVIHTIPLNPENPPVTLKKLKNGSVLIGYENENIQIWK